MVYSRYFKKIGKLLSDICLLCGHNDAAWRSARAPRRAQAGVQPPLVAERALRRRRGALPAARAPNSVPPCQ